MNCPKCGKPLSEDLTRCKHCGARVHRDSDKVARQMATSGRFAMACGAAMILLAATLLIYGGIDYLWQGVLIVLGLLLIFIGKKMR